jgi:GAF domain-containing protein
MDDKHSRFVDSNPPVDPRDVIAQSVVARESSRALRLHRTLETMLELTRSNPPATSAALDNLLDTILGALLIATEAPMGNIQLFDPVTQRLRIRAHRGFKPVFLNFFAEVHDGAACASAFANGRPEVVDDVATSPLFTPASRRAVLDAGVRAVQSLALTAGDRKLGVVSIHYGAAGISAPRREAFAAAAPLVARVVEAALQR